MCFVVTRFLIGEYWCFKGVLVYGLFLGHMDGCGFKCGGVYGVYIRVYWCFIEKVFFEEILVYLIRMCCGFSGMEDFGGF